MYNAKPITLSKLLIIDLSVTVISQLARGVQNYPRKNYGKFDDCISRSHNAFFFWSKRSHNAKIRMHFTFT